MPERAYVIGDLHVGAGANDPLEDFRDDAIFARLCGRIGSAETTLILNGDIVDFAQIPPFDVPKPAHLLWPESVSLQKARTAIAAHPEFFAGLRAFLGRGGRVIYVNGNHDLDVVWPTVQHCLAHALGEPPLAQLQFVVGHTVFHGVHIEHGHAWTPENCPRDPLAFCHPGPDGTSYLERVWGTDFMLQFYNQLERSFPFADNVKPMLTVVGHGLRQGWIGGRELARLFLFLRGRGLPWGGIVSATLDKPKPISKASVVAAFDDVEWRTAVRERTEADATFVADVNRALEELTAAERGVATAPERIDPGVPLVADDTAAATLGLFREERELRAAEERLAHPGITHVVFGHTHKQVDGALEGRLYNYGTWLPSLDLHAPHVKAKIRTEGISLEMLRDARLYTADRRLVRIDADPTYSSKVCLVPESAP